ncbi:hypothetical protein [Delftia phage PhiW-14]|uniref:Uncharacterized protein n=1 Tax=Delftia phage PhiW-14 TaxID=665032 RepID=C9DGC0_BPW14|nr:hypothetical protein DP-phiW-14_gp150 [Delftia phage PhiW-14]ACV50171.1 hypothetical protein [Delftia phage PhiW-14]
MASYINEMDKIARTLTLDISRAQALALTRIAGLLKQSSNLENIRAEHDQIIKDMNTQVTDLCSAAERAEAAINARFPSEG